VFELVTTITCRDVILADFKRKKRQQQQQQQQQQQHEKQQHEKQQQHTKKKKNKNATQFDWRRVDEEDSFSITRTRT